MAPIAYWSNFSLNFELGEAGYTWNLERILTKFKNIYEAVIYNYCVNY